MATTTVTATNPNNSAGATTEGTSTSADGAGPQSTQSDNQDANIPSSDVKRNDDNPSTTMEGNNSEASSSQDTSDEQEVIQRTTLEVYMELVICRKTTVQKIDAKTGAVLHSSFTTDEDPPVVLDVHRVETTEKLTGDKTEPAKSLTGSTAASKTTQGAALPSSKTGSSLANLIPSSAALMKQAFLSIGKAGDATPVDSVKVESAATTPSADISTDFDDSMNETVEDFDDSQDLENVTAGEGEKSPEQTPSTETKIVRHFTRGRRRGGRWKRGSSIKREPVITTRRQAAALTPSTPKSAVSGDSDWAPESAPPALAVKRRKSGRPARTIKRPRKFDSDAEEEEVKDEEQEAGEKQDLDETGEGKVDESVVDNPVEQLQLEEGREVTEEEKELLENVIKASGRTCSNCGKRFATVSGCVRHVQKGTCGPAIACKLCPKVLYSKVMMDRHMQGHRDEEKDGTYKCSDCNRVYATRGGYMKHKRQGTCFKRDELNDDGTVGDFRCALCDIRFKTENLLKLHISKSHESPGNRFECKDCGRVFYSKQGFAKHESAKSCTQPLRCLVCGKMYSNKARESFKVHMKHHMAEANGVQYQCEDCGRTYLTPEALRKHKIKHSEIRPHKCPTCNKSFPMRYMVREHMRTHTGDKPYLCNLCGTSFGNRGHLYRHIRSHELGTLHKRGRPRKNVGPILLKIASKGKSGASGEQGLVMEDGTVSVMEIKSDPSTAEQDASMVSGPTYITVHTADGEVMVDGEVTHSDGQAELTESQLQHVVMQADGMTEPMVIQVIRDLTGGATVYQQVEEAQQTVVSTAQQHEIVEQQAVVTATSSPSSVQRHIVVAAPRSQHSVQEGTSTVLYRTT